MIFWSVLKKGLQPPWFHSFSGILDKKIICVRGCWQKVLKSVTSLSIWNRTKMSFSRARTPHKKKGWGVRREPSRPPGAEILKSGTPKTQENALPETWKQNNKLFIQKKIRKITCFVGVFSLKKLLILWQILYFHLFLLSSTRKIDFFVSYIGEKLREFSKKFYPNTEKLTLNFVLITLKFTDMIFSKLLKIAKKLLKKRILF